MNCPPTAGRARSAASTATAACVPAWSYSWRPGTTTGGPSGGPWEYMTPPSAQEVRWVARQDRYGPVSPNGVTAQTIASAAAHDSSPASGSKPATGGVSSTTSAFAPRSASSPPCFRAAVVDDDPALVGVVVGEGQAALGAGCPAGEGTLAAQLVTCRELHLDHVGAGVGQQPPAVGADRAAEVQHPDPVQRQRIGGHHRHPAGRPPPRPGGPPASTHAQPRSPCHRSPGLGVLNTCQVANIHSAVTLTPAIG